MAAEGRRVKAEWLKAKKIKTANSQWPPKAERPMANS